MRKRTCPPVAVCGVACLEWNLRIEHKAGLVMATTSLGIALEIFSAKEDRSRFDCSGKHLGCLIWASKGLRYGLSGSRVAESGNVLNEVLKGNRPDRQRRVASGEIQPVPKP